MQRRHNSFVPQGALLLCPLSYQAIPWCPTATAGCKELEKSAHLLICVVFLGAKIGDTSLRAGEHFGSRVPISSH